MRTRKLLERLKNNPTGVTFNDVRTLLFREGFVSIALLAAIIIELVEQAKGTDK